MIPKSTKRKIAFFAVIVLLGSSPLIVAALQALFTQTVPVVNSPSAILAANCTSLIKNSTIATTSGNLLLSCGTGPFTQNAQSAFAVLG